MVRNYLVIALRNIFRHKLYSFINIAGLTVGLGCVIFIILFIKDETSFDKWVPESENLYRLDETYLLPGRPPLRLALSDFPLPALLKDNLPEVTAITRFWPTDKTVTVGGRSFSQTIFEVDSNFFQVIRLPLLSGDPTTVLARPDSVILSMSMAHKLFGFTNPMGKTLAVNRNLCPPETISCPNDAVVLRVTGVMRDLPHNTHMRADVLIPNTSPTDSLTEAREKHYFTTNGMSYVRLVRGTDPRAVESKVRPLLDRNVNVLEDLGMKLQASKVIQIHLVPFADLHMDDSVQFGDVPPGSRITLLGLGAIAIVILLVACFNFTNLATARALMRSREIAIRKCVGARRSQLVAQFLSESLLTALIALAMALSLTEILLPAYDSFLQRPITFNYGASLPLLIFIFVITVAAGLASGFYPALILSSFRPSQALRTGGSTHTGSSRLRSTLVVLQFSAATGLAIVAAVIFAQVNFAKNQSLGFRRDNVLVIDTNRRMTESARKSLTEELRNHSGVLEVAASGDIPFSGSEQIAQMRLPGHPEYLTMHRQIVTPGFFHLYGMQMIAGRVLSDARGEDRVKNSGPAGNDGRNIMINRAAAARLGLTPADAVGKTVLYGPSHVRIVGVIADAHTDGARMAVRPTVYLNDPVDAPFLSVLINGRNISEVLSFIDRDWRHFAPGVAIDRHFLDDNFEKLYLADEKQSQMFALFVCIAIFIACLGLFGLTASTAGRRTREIGIRKAFGARTRDVVLLLVWQFSAPVLVANLIAWPVAWYYLQSWLRGFADHIPLNASYFIVPSLAAILLAWATIFTHAWRVGRANPIHALRYD